MNFERIGHLQDQLELVPGDLLDEVSMIEVLRTHRPDEVYNLAAQSFVQTSFGQPVLTGETTALGVTRLLDAIRIVDPDVRFYQASSQRDVRQGRRGARRRETHALLPAQPLRRGQGLRPLDHGQLPRELRPARQLAASCSTTRSPRRGLEFVTRKITHGVARIKLGLDTELRLGNLDAQRDWGFAGDYVEAMWLMLQQDEPDDFVVATGETHSVREFCELAFGHVGLDCEDHVVHRRAVLPPGRGRPARRRPGQGPRGARLEAQDRRSPSWSA